MTSRGVAIALVLFALAVACGEQSFDKDTIRRLDALEGQVADIGVDDPFGELTPEQQVCIETSGDSSLSELAFDAASDPSAHGDARRLEMFTLLIDCVPNLDELDAFVEIVTHNLDSALGTGANVDRTEGGCVLSYVLDNADDPADALSIGASVNSIDTFSAAFVHCFDEESIAYVARAAGSGPQAYGEDADLDRLYDRCGEGDDQACDLLFFVTSEGSEYRTLGNDCAGRGDGVSYCVAQMVTDDQGLIEGDSPGLITLETACSQGEMIACDLLFLTAPIGSDLERVGFTCGGRIAVGAVPNCRTRFAE